MADTDPNNYTPAEDTDATSILKTGLMPSINTQTKAKVTFGLDANPDEAARVVNLEQSTGVPSSVIAPDLDRFDKMNQASMARDLVMNNGQLRDYVNSHMMAAQVSNDDWGTLDKISELASKFHAFTSAPENLAVSGIGGAVSGAASAAKEAFGEAPLYDPAAIAKQFPLADPSKGILAQIANLGEGGVELGLRGYNAAMAGLLGSVGGFASGLGASPELSKGLQEMAEATMMDLGSRVHMGPGDPWVHAGEAPPAGVHPAVDAAKAETNAEGVAQLGQLIQEAQTSTTKNRSPEMFGDFLTQHFGDKTVSVSGDAATKLYGDSPPAPDDGKLGWVPGIADKLDVAKSTGADVDIPVADLVARVDPKLAKVLFDDIRTTPDGITANEAKLAEPPPAMVDAPLAQVRGAAGLEPMFSMGDRKLSLMPVSIDEADPEIFKGGNFHTLEIQDDRGAKVGDLTLTADAETKTLHVEMINGVAGQWANSFGPALILDLKRQLRTLYPGYDKLDGVRISGAAPGRTVSVNLADDAPGGWGSIEATRRAIAEAYRPVGQTGVDVNIQPSAAYLAHEKAIAGAIHEEIAKITGGKLKAQPVAGIRYGGRTPQGVHFPRSGMMMYDLLGNDPVGVGRHEAIHFLRDQGLFTPAEWKTLGDAARDEDWHGRYNIDTRYAGLDREARTEEAVAEGFREWANTKEGARREYSPVAQIFQKLWDFLQNIKQRFAEIFGHLPTKDELFTRIASGEIGERAAQGTAEGARAPQFSEEDHFDNLKASALGLDLKSFQRIQRLVNERHRSDVEASERLREKEQAKRQTEEWKTNKAEMAENIEPVIRQQPVVAADLFLGSGEFNGEKLQQRFTLRAGDLTAEQEAALPKHYVSKHGLPIDDVASLFGYSSGDSMVDHLAAYNAFKESRSPQEMLRHIVGAAADRQMEAKYGNLAQNILTEAKDQALSENSLNLLLEEYHAAAMQAGANAAPLDKDTMKAMAQDLVSKMPLHEVDFNKAMTVIGKNYRDAVRALVAGDSAAAVEALQKRTLSAFIAAEQRRVEKASDQTERLFKTLGKLPTKGGTNTRDPDYLNYEHQIMIQVGKAVSKRSIQGIQADIEARGTGTLQEFAQSKADALRVMPVWEQLFDPSWSKPYDQLLVSEFMPLHETMKALDYNARDELKIIRGGEKVDLEDNKDKLKASVQRFREKAYDANGRRSAVVARIMTIPRTFMARALQMETMLNYWDKFDKWGVWNQSFMRPLIEGANQADRWTKEAAEQFRALDDKVDLSKNIDNPIFRNPLVPNGKGGLMTFTRENLRRILLDAGNSSGPKSNLFKRAQGYGLNPADVMGWLHQYATKEDWDWAQGVWDMWAGIKAKGDNMFRHETGGVAPDDVRLTPIVTKFGTYKGGYYPTNDYHPLFEGTSSKLSGKDSLMQQGYTSATPMPGWAQARTGYAAPLRNDLSNIANLMKSHLYDISMRPALVNAAKVGFDRDIKNAIKLHFGAEYADLIKPYLQGVANRTNYMSTHQAYANGWAEQLRKNLVTSLVGYNPGTVLKHAPTAMVLSINEVGPEYYLKGTRAMYGINEATGESNKKFMDESSLELNRRSQNWQETLYGAVDAQRPGGKYQTLQQEIARLSSSPVAMSDMFSARATWMGEYMKNMEEGRPMGDAVYAADRAVRRAHGSTSITNRPAVIRDSNPWLTSVYTFFNDIFNRQVETLWRAGEMTRDVKADGWASASKHLPSIFGGIFAAAIAPAIIEQLVGGQKSDPNESWTKKILKGLVHTESATLPYVRDIAQAVVEGSEPSLGLTGTAIKSVAAAAQDVWKKNLLSPAHAERMIRDWGNMAGMFLGVPRISTNAAAFSYGVSQGTEHPKGPWGWLVGSRFGTLKGHSGTIQDLMQGRVEKR